LRYLHNAVVEIGCISDLLSVKKATVAHALDGYPGFAGESCDQPAAVADQRTAWNVEASDRRPTERLSIWTDRIEGCGFPGRVRRES
jgi:hypothetical protein